VTAPPFPSVAGAPLLEVRDLTTSFDTPRGVLHAVDHVSLTLEEGRTLGIVGESGSGKSVLVRSILNLVTSRNASHSGSVQYRGVELRGLSVKEMTHVWGLEVAMVFQDPMTSLNPTLKIGAQLEESLWYHLGLRRGPLRETAVALLRSVGIPDPAGKMGAFPHELSGGMRQRVTIAIALACGPKLLVADEPTTALDVTVQKQILGLLHRQQRERAMGLILVTHDFGVVAGRTDEIAVMYAGEIVERAPTHTLFRNHRHPYTQALLQSIPRMSNEPHQRLSVVRGQPPDLVDLPAGCRFAPRCRRAQEACLTERPRLVPDTDVLGHEYACFFPVGTDEGDAAAARNVDAGETAAGLEISADPTEVVVS
jgi:peptide/nickel transport system ATP-binding protein